MPAGDDEGMRVLVVEDHATLAGMTSVQHRR